MNFETAIGHLEAYINGGDELGTVSEADATAAIAALYWERDRLERALHSYDGVKALLRSLLDEHYPADLFAGKSSDEGDLLVAAARRTEQALAERDAALARAERAEAQVVVLRASLMEIATHALAALRGARDEKETCVPVSPDPSELTSPFTSDNE